MSGRAVYFSLPNDRADNLSQACGDEAVFEIVKEIEEEWDSEWLFEVDKAWDAMHRIVTGGNLVYGGGDFPLNQAVLGSIQLLESGSSVVSVIEAHTAGEIADALSDIDEAEFRKRYFKIDKEDYDGEVGEDDFEYTWHNYQGFPDFLRKSSMAGRDIIFTVIY